MSNLYKQQQTVAKLSPGIVDEDAETLDAPLDEPVEVNKDEDEDDTPILSLDNGDKKDEVEDDDKVLKSASYKLTNLQVSKDEKYQCYVPSKSDSDYNTMVALPNHTSKEINASPELHKLVSKLNSTKVKHSENDELWNDMLAACMEHTIIGDLFSNSLADVKSRWHQYLENDGKRLRPHSTRYSIPEEGQVRGDTAQAVLDRELGIGGHITIPLPHSGFWITLKPVDPLDFITLDERLAAVKNNFGRNSVGLVFNNNRVFVVKYLTEFLLERIADCSIEGWQDLNLADYIKVTDLLVLAAAGGYTLYPHGFDYVAPCTADNDCTHIEKAVLKIPNCIWYDHASFTKKQTEMLSNRSAKFPVDKIKEYQEQFENRNNKFESEEQGLTIYFKVPTVTEHIKAGEDWLNEVESLVNAAILSRDDESVKQERMQRRINQTVLRQQAHYFKRVVLKSGNYLEGEEDLYKALNTLSNRSELTEDIMEFVGKYIDSNIHALVAIPRYNCSKCQAQQPHMVEKHPFLIPLDTINLFFTLGNQRLRIGSPNMLARK